MKTEEEKKQAARELRIDGFYPELAKEVRNLLGYRDDSERPFMSSREAARITGVNHTTITTMARGDRPSEGTIFKFAKGMGVDPRNLLELGRYPTAQYLNDDAGLTRACEWIQVELGCVTPDLSKPVVVAFPCHGVYTYAFAAYQSEEGFRAQWQLHDAHEHGPAFYCQPVPELPHLSHCV